MILTAISPLPRPSSSSVPDLHPVKRSDEEVDLHSTKITMMIIIDNI